MFRTRAAFTMVELIFVIVVIGILTAIAVPKLAATRDDAYITRARATVSSLRNAIATERQKRILRGDFTDITGEDAENLLEYGMTPDWSRDGDTFIYSSEDGKTCNFKVENNRLERDDEHCDVAGLDDL